MAGYNKGVEENVDSQFPKLLSRTQSASISIPMESYETEISLVGYTGPLRSERNASMRQNSGPLYINHNSGRLFPQNQAVTASENVDQNDWNYSYDATNAHLMRSGQLGICNDPYCTICPSSYNSKASQKTHPKASAIFDSKFHSLLYGDASGWARRFNKAIIRYVPGVMNPHTRIVQKWNKFFVMSCSVAIFVDPLFFFLLSVQQENKCMVINWEMTKTIVVFRSLTDFIYLLNIILQFRLAYHTRDHTVGRAGLLVDDPKKIALHYIRGCFLIDLFVVLPLPQVIVLLVIPKALGGANYAKDLLRAVILVQYIPRLFRFLPFLIGQSPSGFVFEKAWSNFFINLFTFMLSAHVIGSCWYLFGLQRVNQCLRNACHDSDINDCKKFIDCGHGDAVDKFGSDSNWNSWTNNANASACFNTQGGFSYGIYAEAVNLTGENIISRYIYSLFWGFQQISTFAGNQIPSYFIWEVLFTMATIGLGLLLFAFLIGNMQNFLQALGRRRLEMSLKRRDVDQWMSHRCLPQDLRRRVIEAERFNWAATRDVDEEMLLKNLPEDLQRDIRRHLFKFVKKVWIFSLMDEHVLDAVCEKLKQKRYIQGGNILYVGGLVDKMVFIVRGKLESIGHDGTVISLTEGNVCGEELLTWCLEHTSVTKDGRKIGISGPRLLSSRTVRCLTNVEAFSLCVADVEQVTSVFARNLRNPRVQGAIRYQSPYWRVIAATRIQVAWRYRQKRLKREPSRSILSVPLSTHSSFSKF